MTVQTANPGGLPAGDQPANQPANPEAGKAMDPKAGIQPAPVNQPANEADKKQVPDWVPEKFRNAEDPFKAMADAYAEAERKLGEKGNEKPKTGDADKQAEAAAEAAGFDLSALESEFAANNGLTDDTYAKLAKAGFGKDMVDSFIAYRVAQAEAVTNRFYEAAGGAENYTKVVEWASKNVKPAELDAYNALIDAGNYDAAMLIFNSIVQGYEATSSKLPERTLKATTAANLTGIKPFASQAEITKAMSDPAYRTDPAYREQVYARMAVTDL
ncbi:MAG: hypothetical protein LDL56_00620 [Armatimonadetes bacterium]|nr:hypothetical protein [Armatimonadota bacterium]